MKKYTILLTLILAGVLLSACAEKPTPGCEYATGTPHYLSIPPQDLPTPLPSSGPATVQIERRQVTVDRVVEGPLCNDAWSGTVYVTCNVQVYPWVENPTFLKDCNLVIAPDTVVYVAYHNDTAYYKGCSCHTGEIVGP